MDAHDIAAQWPNLWHGIRAAKQALAYVDQQHPEPPPDLLLTSFEVVNAYAPIESAKRQIVQRLRLLAMSREGIIEHGEGFPPPARVDQLLRADWWRGRMTDPANNSRTEAIKEAQRDAFREVWSEMLAQDARSREERSADHVHRQSEPLKPKLARQGLTLHFYADPRPGQRSSYIGPLPG